MKDGIGKTLITYIDDPVPVVKNAIINNLGTLKYEPAVEDLLRIVLDSSPETFEEIAFALQRIGRPAISRLIDKILSYEDSQQADRYAALLTEMEQDRIVPLVIAEAGFRFNGDIEKKDVQRLVVALRKLNDSQFTRFLDDLKSHTNPTVRQTAQSVLE